LLLENQKLYELPEPNKSDEKELQELLYLKGEYSQYRWLGAPENIFEEEDGQKVHHDLVAISGRKISQDKLTRWAVEKGVDWFHALFRKVCFRPLWPLPLPFYVSPSSVLGTRFSF